jgi:phenylacetate-coenzyme A ligase PaaK-like adenylate-forming protein
VAADGDHFASVTLWRHLDRAWPGSASLVCPVLAPIGETAQRLQRFQPAFLAGYPTVLTLLADEQRAGRLSIRPALLWSGGEHLGERARRRIEEAFGCPVLNEYGASECLSIAHGCAHGWLHVNADWVILEAVEADGRPTPPGKASHTVLVTNLANHVQPILRYDLGDRVLVRGSCCPCGDPMPAIRVEGRNDDTLVLHDANGSAVPLAPLALTTVLDDACGEHRFQLVQRGEQLALRIGALDDQERERIGHAALGELRAFLVRQGLRNVRLSLERAAPRLDRTSGKLRTVVAEPCRTRRR